MQTITAQLNNFRQSPRKVRVVADLVRGKSAKDAVLTLQFADKRAAGPISKLIASALANAKNQSIEADNLMIKAIEVNVGKILYRRRPAAHGSAHKMRKRTSHISVVLSEMQPKDKKSKTLAAQPEVLPKVPAVKIEKKSRKSASKS
jgi:large subunit ribosomal protein L22